jgi:hypothetical protein
MLSFVIILYFITVSIESISLLVSVSVDFLETNKYNKNKIKTKNNIKQIVTILDLCTVQLFS